MLDDKVLVSRIAARIDAHVIAFAVAANLASLNLVSPASHYTLCRSSRAFQGEPCRGKSKNNNF
jgi:hypothetical protein